MLTFIMIFIIIWYTMMQFLRMNDYGEPSIMVSIRDSALTDDYEFSTDKGLMVAFGITAFDND